MLRFNVTYAKKMWKAISYINLFWPGLITFLLIQCNVYWTFLIYLSQSLINTESTEINIFTLKDLIPKKDYDDRNNFSICHILAVNQSMIIVENWNITLPEGVGTAFLQKVTLVLSLEEEWVWCPDVKEESIYSK